MIEIDVRVDEDRERAASVTLKDGSRLLVEEMAVACVDAAIARANGNPQCDPLRPYGHPPFGSYELVARGKTPAAAVSEYGDTLLLFEPTGGMALDAQSFGRLVLPVYAGPAGGDQLLRRTQGGLRLSRKAMQALVGLLGLGTDARLRIGALAPVRWWAFWRRRADPPALSTEGPKHRTSPLDEATLVAGLGPHRARTARPESRDDDDRDRLRDRDSSGASSSEPTFQGRGGTGGGGGASAGWDAPSSGRAAGVDSAGRIVAGAGLAVAAVAVTAAVAAQRDAPGAGSGESDSGASGTESGTSY